MTTTTPPAAVTYHQLQQAVGWTAFLMPIVVRVLAYVWQGVFTTTSISAYYYTGLREVFVGSLVTGGVLLAFFRTASMSDKVIAIVGGLAAIGIALFPMTVTGGDVSSMMVKSPEDAKRYLDSLRDGPHGPLGYHIYFVGAFFAAVFYLVTFRFQANTPAMPTAEKLQRNRWYRRLGILMALAFACIGYLHFMASDASIFWPESIAVMAFAAAWLIKGQLILKDPPGYETPPLPLTSNVG